MRILLTAFDAFGTNAINPTEEILHRFAERKEYGAFTLDTLLLPTSFSRAVPCALKRMEQVQYDVVLSLGLAAGRKAVTLERVAINCMDARIPDNDGACPKEELIVSDGPAAYFATIPNRKIVEAIKPQGIPILISNTAGTFVCNQIFYSLLHHTSAVGKPIIGFVHVPYATEQGMGESYFSMPIKELTDAVFKILEELAKG